MVDKAAISASLDTIVAEAKKLAFEHTAWRQKKTDPAFKIWKSESPNFDGKVYKIETIMNHTPEKLINFIYPLNYAWNPHIEKVDLLEELSDNSLLLHYYMKPSFEGILKGRDGIQAIHVCCKGDMKSICQGSVVVPQYPPEEGKVRAFNHPSGMFIEKLDGGKSKVISIIQADIKSNVPAPILSKAFYHLIEEYHKALVASDIDGAPCHNGKPGYKGC